LTVDSFLNDTSGQSGYYFSRAGANSGWIQTNSWTDTGLSCGHEYTYFVKYRNGDGTETSEINTTKTTSECARSGSSGIVPIVPIGGFKININNGESITSSRKVSLGFNVSTDIKKIAISMTGDFVDASQEDYSVSKQWDLCSKFGGSVRNSICPDGVYTIYVRFYNVWGRTSSVAIASSTIVLRSGIKTESLQLKEDLSLSRPFAKYLQYNQIDIDVKRLQIFLNSDPDTKIADSGVGSPGKETNYFGLLTQRAVVKFQEKYAEDILVSQGFRKGTGYVGKATLAKINGLIAKK
jgi:hypothetical protein